MATNSVPLYDDFWFSTFYKLRDYICTVSGIYSKCVSRGTCWHKKRDGRARKERKWKSNSVR